MIGGIYTNVYTLFALFLLINVGSLLEYRTLTNHFEANHRTNLQGEKIVLALIGTLLYALWASVAVGWLPVRYLAISVPLLSFLFIKELYERKANFPFMGLAFNVLGIVYISLPLALAVDIACPTQATGTGAINSFAPNRLMSVLALLWVNDSLAYICGWLMGKHKLFERISPKKTWEGSIGGAVATLGAAWLIAKISGELTTYLWLVIAFAVITFGTFGDLIESMLKRNVQIKDSGNLLPGHGGLLDRFDALYFAFPMVWAALYLLHTE